jgi:Fe-S oxidoreductase
MNIQQLIENAKQSLNAPQHHNAFDESFESCIKYTACTAICPISHQNPNYPGPKQSGPDNEHLRLKSAELYDKALKYCTNCKRCEIACPSDVKIGDIIIRARNKYQLRNVPKEYFGNVRWRLIFNAFSNTNFVAFKLVIVFTIGASGVLSEPIISVLLKIVSCNFCTAGLCC